MPTKEEIAFFEERAKDYQEKFGRNYKADTIIAFLATEFRTALQNDKRISRFFKALTKQENDVLRTLRTAQDAV